MDLTVAGIDAGAAEARHKPSLERTSASAVAPAGQGSTTPKGGSRVNSPGALSDPSAGEIF